MKRALIIVDMQYDFMPGGALAVPEGDYLVPIINELQTAYPCVVATQDWHPADHGSFAGNHRHGQVGAVIDLHGLVQVLWPDHCLQGSPGARLHADLCLDRVAAIFRKGMDPAVDSYSAFFDNGHRHDTGLAGYLRAVGVDAVDVCGLAADYCVRFTALDAIAAGFRTRVMAAATRGVNLRDDDTARAFQAIRDAGGQVADRGRPDDGVVAG